MRRRMSFIMACLMILLQFTGCSRKDAENKEAGDGTLTAGGMGRYVEEDMPLPDGVDTKEVISLADTPDGSLDLYVHNNGVYEKYSYADQKWNRAEEESIQKFNVYTSSGYLITKVFYGEDNELYLLGNTLSYHNALYRLSDDGVYERVKVKRFEETYEEWNDIPRRPKFVQVLENGMIAVSYPWREIEVYSADGQTMVGSYSCGRSCVLAADGNILYYTNQNDNELLTINMETMKEGASREIEIEITDTGILDFEEGTAYLCDVSGIHMNQEGGSMWETLVDGSMSSLSMPSVTLAQFIIGSAKDYYLAFTDMENNFTIKYIFYDENAGSVPLVELSIFSIEDNATISQAINVFRESHPEVKVNFRVINVGKKIHYTYGIKDPEETVPLKDHINALNTELLAGRGADILVLDGLPVESYIEKGVLEDMGSLFNPMVDSDELLANITEPYFSKGKVYAMPVRFVLPVLYGSKEAIKAAETLQGLAEYAKNSEEIPLLYPSNYRALAAWMLMIYNDRFMNGEKQIDEASLREFFETIRVLSDSIHASEAAELDFMNSNKKRTVGYWITSCINVHKKTVQANIEELGGIMDFAVPLVAAEQWQGSFTVLNNVYKAKGLIGINSAGSQKELAKEFVQLLYTKEIQSLDLLDGFPVNRAALEEWIQIEKPGYGFSVGGEDYTIHAFYPVKINREKIYESICAIDQPMVNDTTIVDMILDEAERYLKGDITKEQAAKNAVGSINTYLSE